MKFKLFIDSKYSPPLITLEKTDLGWLATADTDQNLKCDKTGGPGLFQILASHGSVNYPDDLSGFMENWWKMLEKGMDERLVQSSMDMMANWISDIDKSRPQALVLLTM